MNAIDFIEDSAIDFQQESIPIDFQPEGKSDKYLAMQAEQAALAKKDKGGTAMKALEFTEGVMDKAAHPVRAIMDFPVHLTQALGGQAQTVSTIPFVSPEAATKAIEKTIEFVSPFREASEGSFGQTVQEFAGEILSGMTSPEMVGTLAVSPASPAAVARYFQGQMLSQVPASVAAVAEAEPGKEQNKAILAAAANVIFPALIEKGMTPVAPKAVLEARAAEVGPATEAVVKGKEAVQPPPEPSVPLATAASESVKPAGVELPALAERPLPTISTETPAVQPAMAERVTELRAPDKTGLATEPPAELMAQSKPELVGMGAATPAEYAQTPQTATGIRNAIVDADLVKRGLPPAMTEARRANDVFWEQAMAQMDRDPGLQKRLIDELANKPRAVSDTEVAILTHRKVDLENEYGKATRDLAQAFDDGRMEDVAREQVRTDALREELHGFYTVTRAAGTEQARGLAARRLLVFEDFTLAKMELERRAAKGGERLTAEERAEVVTLQQKIETTQKAYDTYVAKTQQQISALEVKAALQAATQKAQADVPPKVLEIAKRIVNNLHREADAARARLKSQGVKFGSGPLHELPNIRDFAIIGADHLVTTGVKFAEWSGKMVKEFGEGIKPHLQAIFEESQKTLNTIDKNSAFVQPVKRAKAKPTVEETKLSYEATQAKKEWQQKLIQEQRKQRTTIAKVFDTGAEIVNMARVLMTTGEFSAVLKQGGFTGLGNPVRTVKAIPAMWEALRSEQGMHGVNLEIASRSNYPNYVRDKLFLSEHGHSLSKMEEATMSRWADKIPVLKNFQRSHPTFLNKLRADSYDALAATLVRRGNELTPERGRAIADFINISTGRATFGKLERSQAATEIFTRMNQLFFAPRWVASRFQLAAGVPLWRAIKSKDPAMVRLIAEEYAKFLTGLGVIYGLWMMSGGEIGTDPKKTDFGKLKVGATDVDLMAGLQQGTVLMTRLATGEKTTVKGKTVPITGEKVRYGGDDAFDVVATFLRTKLAPVPASVVDLRTGKDVTGKPVTLESEMKELSIPLTYRDIYKAMREHGTPEDAALALIALFGAGVQTKDER